MTVTSDALPKGDSKMKAPKLLLYVDRNVDTEISRSKQGKKTIWKKHTEVVSCYQTKDGTEESKASEPTIVVNREHIDWSISKNGSTLETLSQWHETFKVNQHAKFEASKSFDKDHEPLITSAEYRPVESHVAHGDELKPESPSKGLQGSIQDEWIDIELYEALIEKKSPGDGDQDKPLASKLFHLLLPGFGSPSKENRSKEDDGRSLGSYQGIQPMPDRSFASSGSGRMSPTEIIKVTRSQISVEKSS